MREPHELLSVLIRSFALSRSLSLYLSLSLSLSLLEGHVVAIFKSFFRKISGIRPKF